MANPLLWKDLTYLTRVLDKRNAKERGGPVAALSAEEMQAFLNEEQTEAGI